MLLLDTEDKNMDFNNLETKEIIEIYNEINKFISFLEKEKQESEKKI